LNKIIIAGAGTDQGKTIVSAIFTTLLQGDYWKPVQSGGEENFDSDTVKKLIDPEKHCIYPSAYCLKAPLSPHHAARLENITIDITRIIPPKTSRPLIIEGVGGVLVPLTKKNLTIDLFVAWNAKWIIVSRHYVGSINHTLLTINELQKRNISIAGIIFNGEFNPDSEAAILEFSQLPVLGRLLPETMITPKIIQRYAKQWTRPTL